MFRRRKCDHEEELNTVQKRLRDVDNRLLRLELDIDTFRDKVLRKIQRRKKPKETDDSEDLSSKVLVKTYEDGT